MKNRKPYDLKYVMILYDFGQVVINSYLTYTIYTICVDSWEHRCMVKNNPVYIRHNAKRIQAVAWHTCLIKFIDLIDTVLFVLRKKANQVSFLHVFHHALMCMIITWAVRNIDSFAIGFYLGFAMSINTSVHVVVYFYYGVSALGPQMNKYLWWKKYLTLFQMCQFTAILSYMLHGFMTGCEEVAVVEVTVFLYIVAIFIMFIDFYKKYKDE
ncbi:hypothetical protein JTE90_005353 [Oedothorax gibbosus]|uniref:Elongation of very long chain fatty acids protein n=1 Tax=Oedothorax gibbosus TaxID=931172 RepID=A0AAV6UIT8_9ARAC|nr:hypothetical protein JTE90_005353 [Oedothorax gibbosus]